jgi:hypothetical protein
MSDEDIKENLNKNLENAEVLSYEDNGNGSHSMEISVGPEGLPAKELAYLTGEDGEASPMKFWEGGRNISRDWLRRVDVDLLIGKPQVTQARPEQLYDTAINTYHSQGQIGTIIDTLTNFAAKGFKNDIDDPQIKLFYDTWTREIGFHETVEKIFFDFFRVGLVRTFKISGKFDPKLKPEDFDRSIKNSTKANMFSTTSDMQALQSHTEWAAAKKLWSKSFIPLQYTILDPRLVLIQGPLLFDQTETLLKPEAFKELRKMLKNTSSLTKEQRSFVNSLPKELKEQVAKNKPVKLPPELVGKCDYRRQDYERYPKPKLARALDDIRYKEELKKADYSTLDGITNYILKVTIGNDEHPVTDQSQLEAIANLFDTSSKSFDIVWNHTLDVEKITFPEIDNILGQGKFAQVNDDLSTAMGVTRALLDGQVAGNAKAIETATKAFAEEINYARRCVTRWIDHEYEEVALAMGFSRYPKVRFDENTLKDEIMLMSVIQGMIDRRIISYETGIEKLGFDFSNEYANMLQESPAVQAGVLGIIGSPYNPQVVPTGAAPTQDNTPGGVPTTVTDKDLSDLIKNMDEKFNGLQDQIQKTQRTPKGTPSEGRPRKGRGKPRTKSTTPNTRPKKPSKST